MLISLTGDYVELDEIFKEAGFEVEGGPTPWGKSFWTRALLCEFDGVMYRLDKLLEVKREVHSEALIFGLMTHSALYLWYRGEPLEKCLKLLDAVIRWAGIAGPNSNPYAMKLFKLADKAQGLMTAYAGFYHEKKKDMSLEDVATFAFHPDDIIGTEMVLETDDPFPLSARLDLIVKLRGQDGRPIVATVDHKTHSRFDTVFETAFWQDTQLSIHSYLWNKVAVAKGYPPMTHAIINVLDKPDGAHKEWGFRRLVYPLDQNRIALWLYQMTHRAQGFLQTWNVIQEAWDKTENKETFDVSGIWQEAHQNHAACFERRYGKSCERIEHCLSIQSGLTVFPPELFSQRKTALELALEELGSFPLTPVQAEWSSWVQAANGDELILRAAKQDAQRFYPLFGDTEALRLSLVESWIERLRASTPTSTPAPAPAPITVSGAAAISQVALAAAVDPLDAVPLEAEPVILSRVGEPVKAAVAERGKPYYVGSDIGWCTGEVDGPDVIFLAPGRIRFTCTATKDIYPVELRSKEDLELLTPAAQQATVSSTTKTELTEPKAIGEAPWEDLMVPVLYFGEFPSADKGKKLFDQMGTDKRPCYVVIRVGNKEGQRQLVTRIFILTLDEVQQVKMADNQDLWAIIVRGMR